MPSSEGWEVRQEGLPDKTTRHASQEEAWEEANARASRCHGEAFLGDGAGGTLDQKCYRTMPRKMKI